MGNLNIQKRISEILKRESEAIASVGVTPEYEKAVLALRACQGKVLTTGMGKAGHVARKFAATLCSTGTPAAYVHPGEAAHGDLGLIAPRDCIVAFSTSGKTNEVIEMLELGRHLGLETIIGITSHPDSHLRDLADVILDMGVIEEPCPLGLTPSASIAVMLAIGDALALALMELKGVTKHDYGLRHHGGYLGRKARTDNV
jgi:arabinose-5-phosphate isomerase